MKLGWDSRAGKKGLLSRFGSSGCISLIENGLADVGELIRGVQALYGGEINIRTNRRPQISFPGGSASSTIDRLTAGCCLSF